jgi:hypothetical protein
MLKEAKEKPDKDLTWNDALHYERAVILNLNNEDGVSMKKEGANASEGFRLTVEKDNKVYHFQKSEKVAPKNDQATVKGFFEGLQAEEEFKEKVLKPIFDGIYVDAGEENKYGTAFFDFFADLVEDKTSDIGIMDKLVQVNSNAKNAIRALDQNQKTEAAPYIKKFAKLIFQRAFATL